MAGAAAWVVLNHSRRMRNRNYTGPNKPKKPKKDWPAWAVVLLIAVCSLIVAGILTWLVCR